MARTRSPLVGNLEFFAFRAPVEMFRRLSFPAAFRLGERLGDIAYAVARPQRKTALVNLRIAFPEKSDAERLGILRESCRNFGRMAAEWCHMYRLTQENVATRVRFAETKFWSEELPRILSETGLLVLTGHFGNWELFAHAIGLYGYPIHLVHRPFHNERFDAFVNAERRRSGTRLISKRTAAPQILRALRAHGIAAIAFDQNATGRWGVFADFFSVPASTHPGLARLHAISGAPVRPVFMVRQGGTPQHSIVALPRVDTVATSDRGADTLENMRRFNKVFEDLVREYPEQWIWMHKRWRTRPPGEPPIY